MIFKESLSVCQTTKKTEANKKLNKRRKKNSIGSYLYSAIKIHKYVNKDKHIKTAEIVHCFQIIDMTRRKNDYP